MSQTTHLLNRTQAHPHTASADTSRTYATRLLRAEVPIEVVAELLGHASPQTTAEIYSHLNVEDHRRVLLSAGIIRDGASVR
ncbi:tyrosine-type recombinase/integrase [Streptomyces sp. NPDC020766]|uniref:tyrosine-type recombinase/integrase n=1 Tax=Streptomyces sp. NPDC020766 TaxID=3155011 RepID=UPI0033ECB475